MTLRPKYTITDDEIARIDGQLIANSRSLGYIKDPKTLGKLTSAIDGLLDRRYRLYPVVHRCLSEERWAVLHGLEEA